MKLLIGFSFLIFFATGCTSTGASFLDDHDEDFVDQTKQLGSKPKSNDVYSIIEGQIQQFKPVHLQYQLPSLAASSPAVQIERPISDYVQDQVFYNSETFEELSSTIPPQGCQKLLLVSKKVKNRKSALAKLANEVSKGTKFDRTLSVSGSGIHVRLDPSLKIKSFMYSLREQKKLEKELIDSFTALYGYPTELRDIPNVTKAYGWGVEYDKQKYIVVASHFTHPSGQKKPANYNYMAISAYRVDRSSCPD